MLYPKHGDMTKYVLRCLNSYLAQGCKALVFVGERQNILTLHKELQHTGKLKAEVGALPLLPVWRMCACVCLVNCAAALPALGTAAAEMLPCSSLPLTHSIYRQCFVWFGSMWCVLLLRHCLRLPAVGFAQLSRLWPASEILLPQTTKKEQCLTMHLVALTAVQMGCLHSAVEAREKAALLRRFNSGQLRALLLTDAFGLGLDFKDVDAVLGVSCIEPQSYATIRGMI
jgi:Lhr-like helicase